MKDLTVVLWDIETSMSIVGSFSLYPESINHENILEDWYIICACWKYLNRPKIHGVSGLDDLKRFKKNVKDDFHVVKTLRDMLEDVDILIGHNSDKFDIKKFNSRLIYHNLPPLPKILTVDTLKEVRKIASFTSNRLDYLGKHLCGEGKADTSRGLWLRAMMGDKKAIEEMVKYNKVDVKVLEDVYLKLRRYMKSHPNLAEPLTTNCPKCGSDDVKKHDVKMRASGVRYQQYQCKNCCGYFSDTKSLDKPNSKVG